VGVDVLRDRHVAIGSGAIAMLEKRGFALKVVALTTVRTGKSLKLIGRRFSDYVPSTKGHADPKRVAALRAKSAIPRDHSQGAVQSACKAVSAFQAAGTAKTIWPAGSGGSGQDGHDEDRARRLSVYSGRRLLTLSPIGGLLAQKCL
jgi:hypothetical protein